MFGTRVGMRLLGNLFVGKPEVQPDKPSHVAGVHEGNEGTRGGRQKGIHPEMKGPFPGGKAATSSAGRSTGINALRRNPIDPRMPNLSPA